MHRSLQLLKVFTANLFAVHIQFVKVVLFTTSKTITTCQSLLFYGCCCRVTLQLQRKKKYVVVEIIPLVQQQQQQLNTKMRIRDLKCTVNYRHLTAF